jgi:hypothetical protein
MAFIKSGLAARSSEKTASDQAEQLLPLRPFIVLKTGIVDVKNPPRVIFAAPSQFICLEEKGRVCFLNY